MTMRFSQLITHWEPDTAYEIIQFLDQLRDALCDTYGEAIAQRQREYAQQYDQDNEEQLEMEFDDQIPF
jgi:hypothetical protein